MKLINVLKLFVIEFIITFIIFLVIYCFITFLFNIGISNIDIVIGFLVSIPVSINNVVIKNKKHNQSDYWSLKNELNKKLNKGDK